jgi:hypothetical protein
MYLGGSIMTFALPYGAFIVIASVLFFLYRRPHSGPRLKYLSPGPVTAVGTREPGPVPAPAPKAAEAAAPEAPAPEAAAPATPAPEAAAPEAAGAGDDATGPASEGKE